jgi:uncharacterized membrane protein YfcA
MDDFMDLISLFIFVYFLATLFATAGIGSAVALVPLLNLFGIELNSAKAIGLFVNSTSTMTSSYMNYKRKTLDIKFATPLIITSAISSPIGALCSAYVSVEFVKTLLMIFVFSSATIMLIQKKPKLHYTRVWILYLIGFVVGLFSGMIGIGGGAYIVLLLVMLGYDAKRVAYSVSIVIFVSTALAFLTYSTYVDIDYYMLAVSAFGAVLGGYSGNRLMHYKLNSSHIKKIIIALLYLIAIKMGYDLFI